ncbi:MAG: adenylyltransferase/cytidyltransferase family protein, partial [Cetobacterium somerae]
MKVGVVIGKFYPFHVGHANMILQATKHVDTLLVMPCFTDGETMPIHVRTECIQDWVNSVKDSITDCVIQVEPITDKLPASEDSRTSDYEVSKVWAEWLKKKHPNVTHF